MWLHGVAASLAASTGRGVILDGGPCAQLLVWEVPHRALDLRFGVVKLAQCTSDLSCGIVVIGASCAPQCGGSIIDSAQGTFEIGLGRHKIPPILHHNLERWKKYLHSGRRDRWQMVRTALYLRHVVRGQCRIYVGLERSAQPTESNER